MINPDSLLLRRTAIAYMFRNAVNMDRRDNLAFYDAVLKEGLEFPQMQQQPRSLALGRRVSAQDLAEIQVGAMDIVQANGGVQGTAFRFVYVEQGSTKPFKFFVDTADIVHGLFERTWGPRHGPLQIVEASIVGTLSVDNKVGGAARYLAEQVLGGDARLREMLGRDVDNVTVKLGSAASLSLADRAPGALPLTGAQTDLTIESQVGDDRLLVLTLLAKWVAIRVQVAGAKIPEEVRKSVGDKGFVEMNVQAKEPNAYLRAVYDYLERRVVPFVTSLSR